MKYNKYTGIAINDDKIVGLTGHVEDELIIIDDAVSLHRNDSIDQDLALFINKFSLQDHKIGIVCNCPTFTHMIPFNGDLDSVGYFLEWNITDLVPWPKSEYTDDSCLRKNDSDNAYIYVVTIHRNTLDEIKKAIHRNQCRVTIIDYWPIPLAYNYTYRTGFITGIVEGESIQLWCWWKSVCVEHITVSKNGGKLVEAIEHLGEVMRSFGIEEVQGVKIYGLEHLSEDEQYDIRAIEEEYGLMEVVQMHITSRGEEAFRPNETDWDMALGVLIRGLNYVDGNR